MTSCIEGAYSASLEVLKENPHLKTDAIGFVLALIMVVGMCICVYRGNNYFSEFYTDIGKCLAFVGTCGCGLICIVRVKEFVEVLKIKMGSPV